MPDGFDQHPYGPGSHAPLDDKAVAPHCYPIKGNEDSKLYHRPDSSSYEETGAEVWFLSPSAAEAAGFELSPSHPDGSSSADFEPGGSGHPCSVEEVGTVLGGGGSGAAAATAAASGAVASAGGEAAPEAPYGPGSHAPLANVHDMPDCYPIKGNADSMKYHRPDSQGYADTKAEVWFVSPSAAEAAGFVLAGSHPEGSSSADFEPGGSGHPCSADRVGELGMGHLLLGGGAVAAAAAIGGAVSGDGGDDVRETVRVEDDVADDVRETVRVEDDVAGDVRETVRVEGDAVASLDEQVGEVAATENAETEVDDDGIGAGTIAAGAAALGAAAVGAAALRGDGADEIVEVDEVVEAVEAEPVAERVEVTAADEPVEKVAATERASARETVRTEKAAATRKTVDREVAAGAGGRGGAAVTAEGGGSGWGWLRWLLPLLLLALLLGLLLWACSRGGDDDVAANPAPAPTATTAPEPTATPEPEPTATPEPEPTATPEPEPTATPEPEPTATPEPEPEPTATPEPQPECSAVLDVLSENGFSTLATAISLAGGDEALAGRGGVTIFAPTDEAFAAVSPDVIGAVLADRELLETVLMYHALPQVVRSGQLAEDAAVTFAGSTLAIRTDGSAPTINAAGVTTADLEAGDCVVHGIDSLLVPPSLLTTVGIPSLNAAVGGQMIGFDGATADLTDADAATLQAICNLLEGESSTDGLPPLLWAASGDADLDAAREAAVAEALGGCADGLTFSAVGGAVPEFTG